MACFKRPWELCRPWRILLLSSSNLSFEQTPVPMVSSPRDARAPGSSEAESLPPWTTQNRHFLSSLVSITSAQGHEEGAECRDLAREQPPWGSGWAHLDLHGVLLGPIPIILLLPFHELPEVLLDEECGIELAHRHLVICRGANKAGGNVTQGSAWEPGGARTGRLRHPSSC